MPSGKWIGVSVMLCAFSIRIFSVGFGQVIVGRFHIILQLDVEENESLSAT